MIPVSLKCDYGYYCVINQGFITPLTPYYIHKHADALRNQEVGLNNKT